MNQIDPLTVALDIRRAERREAPLHGLTFVVKENIDVEGLISRNGHPAFAATSAPASRNAPAVERLLDAGARLVGKAHMDEMAFSLMGANSHYGTPLNPAAPERHPGGSSSGSAAAVAGGLADFALGTDTAGSCRAPAAFCGLFGFRPSHGAIPLSGVVPLASSLDAIGWFARDVETLARVGDVLLPHNPWREPFLEALCLEDSFVDCEPDYSQAAQNALDRLAETSALGRAALGENFWPEALDHFRKLQAYEAWRAHGAWIEAARPAFGPGIKERFEFAATISRADKEKADAFRREARKLIEKLFRPSALVVLPTAPFAAPALDESAEELDKKRCQMVRLFLLASFFGLPQISFPLLRPKGEPPLGLSLIGPRGSDRALIGAARNLWTPAQ